ncbi:hypothetical protein [Lactococcus kimchii]|uniref:hypothetical protein n=1 Tax=Lactococcus sp. S-13 TaxID=2507158 RepID=UPI001023F1C6|nr:hypothetical protein [Lactococcus sp. S-13]RZI49218.1 hypothetical protein EQJ87_07060 [Lactococcus sp. S-13]
MNKLNLWSKLRNTSGNKAAQRFVQDKFYENGSKVYKLAQALVAIIGWLVLLFPLLIMINSILEKPLFTFIYHWSGKQGHIFLTYISIVVVVGILVLGTASFFLVRRNNLMEIQKLAEKKFYDEEKNKIRLALMEELYSERFGDKTSRESAGYYVVSPEQNFPKNYIRSHYKENENEPERAE